MVSHLSLRPGKRTVLAAAALIWSAVALLLIASRSSGDGLVRGGPRSPFGLVRMDDENAARLLVSRALKVNDASATNLVVINALGRPKVVPVVHSNAVRHFREDPSWACLVFLYVDESVIPNFHPGMGEIDSICTTVRIPGMRWGNWLQLLHPNLTKRFEKVAILLDDVVLPVRGSDRVDVSSLVRQMDEHGLSSIGPAVAGSHFATPQPRDPEDDGLADCTTRVGGTVEIYFRIFSREAWSCFYGMLDYRNSRGWCYDACLPKVCGGDHAVDYRMRAYHVGGVGGDVPAESREALNELNPEWEEVRTYTDGVDREGPASDHDPLWAPKRLCDEYECELETERRDDVPLECRAGSKVQIGEVETNEEVVAV